VLAPLLLIIVGAIAWWLMASSQQFLPAFARLLTAPTIKRGPLSLFSGRSYATGQFKGETSPSGCNSGAAGTNWGISLLPFEQAARRRSTPVESSCGCGMMQESARCSRLRRRNLLLTVEDGWLKTMWKPIGFTVFPGSFAEEKWRPVLDAMQTVATSLETAG
jgi:hypothetical protein